jgi:hypothetical protein
VNEISGTAAGFLIVAKTEEAGPVFLVAGSWQHGMFVFHDTREELWVRDASAAFKTPCRKTL